jgi:subtilisin-like proprotein convertase family protein
MKRVLFFLTLCSALCLGSLTSLSAQTPPATSLTHTYTYSGYPVAIPIDSANIAVLLKVTFPKAMTIQKVTASVQVNYPDVGDLNIYMFSPAGTRVKVLERN